MIMGLEAAPAAHLSCEGKSLARRGAHTRSLLSLCRQFYAIVYSFFSALACVVEDSFGKIERFQVESSPFFGYFHFLLKFTNCQFIRPPGVQGGAGSHPAVPTRQRGPTRPAFLLCCCFTLQARGGRRPKPIVAPSRIERQLQLPPCQGYGTTIRIDAVCPAPIAPNDVATRACAWI